MSNIKQLGTPNSGGKTEVNFRDLLEREDGDSDALLGVLLTARKHKVCGSR